ncbi:glycoside hydrolase family 97 protein [Sphingomonas ursincola]|uniref:glycoside hydrolase family 97 protein n=1 Tax=Sphingomonas ursincola TaxID=56361 RepID=UPI00235491DB|nr:glycoside hydrolase family 97 protein [Sphingomonas ursincola]MBY0619779.1 glycoside hydrolase family 97 protein [Sphingomonas ursincola]
MRSLLLALLTWLAALAAPALAQSSPVASVASPDGRVRIDVTIDGEGWAQYAVSRDGKPLIAPSRLGFQFTDQDGFGRNSRFVASETASANTSWQQPWGERRTVTDRHNELLVRLVSPGASDALNDRPTDRPIAIRFRAFDNGIGFRYEFAARADGKPWRIADELTEFVIAAPGQAWWIQAGDWNRYEYLYHATQIDQVSAAHTPMTVKLADGTHLAFHEAALVDYAAMWLKRVDGQRFRATLSPSSRGAKVERTGAFTTPWRSIRIASSAGGLYDNDLELNLNEPNRLGDTSWFTPHKYVGVWWEMHLETKSWASGPKHGATNDNVRRHIDFAAKHGFRGVLVEGWNKGWDGNWFGNGRHFDFVQSYPDFDLPDLAAYARQHGVRLIGHHETGGNIAKYESQLGAALDLYARHGVDAVKTGYVADAGGIIAPGDRAGEQRMEWHDGQLMAQHHLKVVQKAAARRIAVNPHEPIKDTGLRRTYPNWVSREGARGGEYQAWGTPGNGPRHAPTLVFTRMLAGPMDYTPGILSLKGRGGRDLESTLARELALYVVLYSPIQMVADLIENLEAHPRELAFIEKVPTDWEESRTLLGEVGQMAVIARKDRNGPDWYIGGVTDDKAREAAIDLSFLPPGSTWRAHVWRDGDSADYRTEARHQIVIEQKPVAAGDTLNIRMAPGGGFAIRLERLGR